MKEDEIGHEQKKEIQQDRLLLVIRKYDGVYYNFYV